jgi:DNA-binding CsgD family transcriptional regulator
VLVLDASLSVAAITADAERWMTELADAAPGAGSVPPAPVLAVAASVHHSGDESAGMATSSRVRALTRAGRWVTISASRFTGSNLAGHTAVTLQRSGPEVTDLVLEAHGLTARERQLAGLVLHGLSNDEIAQRLFLSRYTVGDHVKAILRKVGAGSKQEFIASTLGGPNRAPRALTNAAPRPASQRREHAPQTTSPALTAPIAPPPGHDRRPGTGAGTRPGPTWPPHPAPHAPGRPRAATRACPPAAATADHAAGKGNSAA